MAANLEKVQINSQVALVQACVQACREADLTKAHDLIENKFADPVLLNNAKQQFLAAAIWNLAFSMIDYLNSKLNYTDQDYQEVIIHLHNTYGRVVPLNQVIQTNEDWYQHYQQFKADTSWLYNERGLTQRGYEKYLEKFSLPMCQYVVGMRSLSGGASGFMIYTVDPMGFIVNDPHGIYSWNHDETYDVAADKGDSAGFQAKFLNTLCRMMIERLNISLSRLGSLRILEDYRLRRLSSSPQGRGNLFTFHQLPNQGNQEDTIPPAHIISPANRKTS